MAGRPQPVRDRLQIVHEDPRMRLAGGAERLLDAQMQLHARQ
jgi:hypothetical protein